MDGIRSYTMNTPNKLNSGDEFRGGVVRTVNAIIDYLRATRIVADNRTIFANQTPAGVMLSGKTPDSGKGGGKVAAASVGYNGPFAVSYAATDSTSGTATIIDGGAPESGIAGYVRVISEVFEVASGTIACSSSNPVVYLRLYWDSVNEKMAGSYIVSAITIADTAIYEYIPLAVIDFPGGTVRQLQYGAIRAGNGRAW